MKLIDKDAVVAEIERRIENLYPKGGQGMVVTKILKDHYEDLLSFINALEVKEVDLGEDVKEALAQVYIDYTFKRHNIEPDSKEGQLIYYAYIHGINACLKELKAQKG